MILREWHRIPSSADIKFPNTDISAYRHETFRRRLVLTFNSYTTYRMREMRRRLSFAANAQKWKRKSTTQETIFTRYKNTRANSRFNTFYQHTYIYVRMYIFEDISSIAHNSPNFEFKSRGKVFGILHRERVALYRVVFRRAKQEQDKQARAGENLT